VSLLSPLRIRAISVFYTPYQLCYSVPFPLLCGKYLEWQQNRSLFFMAFKCLPVDWVIPDVSASFYIYIYVMSYDGAWISWRVQWVSVDQMIQIWFPMKLRFFFATIFIPVVGLPTSCSVGTAGLFPSDKVPRACNNTLCDGCRNSWSFRLGPSR
jgi:hypothetical protein